MEKQSLEIDTEIMIACRFIKNSLYAPNRLVAKEETEKALTQVEKFYEVRTGSPMNIPKGDQDAQNKTDPGEH